MKKSGLPPVHAQPKTASDDILQAVGCSKLITSGYCQVVQGVGVDMCGQQLLV